MKVLSSKPVIQTQDMTIEFSGREIEVLKGILGHLDFAVFKDIELNGASANQLNVTADEADGIAEMFFDVLDEQVWR